MIRPSFAVVRQVLCLAVIAGGCAEPTRYSQDHGRLLNDSEKTTEIQQDRPPTARTLFTLAGILAMQGKDRECEFVLQRCIDDYPQFMPAYHNLTESLMRQGRIPEAVTILSNALRIQPKNPVLLNNLGMCLMIRGQCSRALECFTQAAGLRPENRRYRANMATALGLLGRHEESLSLLRQVLHEPQAEHNAQVLRRAAEKVPQSSSPLPD